MKINTGVQFHKAPPVDLKLLTLKHTRKFLLLAVPGGAFYMIIRLAGD
jgi:hypothetical protein